MRIPHSLQRTWALLIAAIVFYLPANLFPIMVTEFLGQAHTSTILGGVVTLWADGSYPIATIIFIASVLVPVVKILALGWLCLSVSLGKQTAIHGRSHLYRAMEIIGRWSMVDVFVVAVLFALVRLGAVMSIIAGPAALSFSAVVVATIAAANSFDPRLMWDRCQITVRELES